MALFCDAVMKQSPLWDVKFRRYPAAGHGAACYPEATDAVLLLSEYMCRCKECCSLKIVVKKRYVPDNGLLRTGKR